GPTCWRAAVLPGSGRASSSSSARCTSEWTDHIPSADSAQAGDDLHLVLKSGGLVQRQEERVDGDPALLPRRLRVRHGARVDLHAEVALYPGRRLVQLADGPLEVELALPYPVGVLLRHAKANEAHGVHEVTLDAGRLALPGPRSLDRDQLRYGTVFVSVSDKGLEVEDVEICSDLQRESVLQGPARDSGGRLDPIPPGLRSGGGGDNKAGLAACALGDCAAAAALLRVSQHDDTMKMTTTKCPTTDRLQHDNTTSTATKQTPPRDTGAGETPSSLGRVKQGKDLGWIRGLEDWG
ncbi:hypothetical protein THAOC_15169, partial [Thalassiosira oceanica]